MIYWAFWSGSGDGSVLAVLISLAMLTALLSLDDTSFAQTWFSQPLPAGILAGVVVGDLSSGASLGLLFQALTVANLPVGLVFRGEQVSAVVAGVGSLYLTGISLPPWLQAGGSLAGSTTGWLLLGVVLCSMVGRLVVDWERRTHQLWMLAGFRSLRDGTLMRFEMIHLRCMLITFLRGFVLFMVWTLLLTWLWLPLLHRMPARVQLGCSYLPWLVPAVTVGVLMSRYGYRVSWPWIATGCLVGVIMALGL